MSSHDITFDTNELYQRSYMTDGPSRDDFTLYELLLEHIPALDDVEQLVDLGAGSGGLIQAALRSRPELSIRALELSAHGCRRIFERVADMAPPPDLLVHRTTLIEGLTSIHPKRGHVFVLCRVLSHLSLTVWRQVLNALRVHLDSGSTLYIADRCWKRSDWDGDWGVFLEQHIHQLPHAVMPDTDAVLKTLNAQLPPTMSATCVGSHTATGQDDRDAFILRVGQR